MSDKNVTQITLLKFVLPEADEEIKTSTQFAVEHNGEALSILVSTDPLCPCCGEGLKQDWAKNQPIWLPHIFATNMQEAVQDTKNGTTRRLSGSTSHCHPRSESPITSSVMSQSYLIFQRNMCHAMCRGGDHCLADGCTGVGKFYEPGGVRQRWSTLTKGRYLV